MAWAYSPQILLGRAPRLCNFDITTTTKKRNDKNNAQTQAPKPHTYKTICALGTFSSGFKHGILSSHFQIIRWDAEVTWPLWMLTWLWGWGGPAVRRGRQIGKESLVTFLVHLWLGKNNWTIYRNIQDSLSCFFLLKVLLGNSAHISPNYKMLFKWYDPMNYHIDHLTLAISNLIFKPLL